LVEQDIEKTRGIKFLQRNLSMIANGHIRHDPSLVASSIIELICDDLKYQDKENDPQYLMLNNKLREEKRINKIKIAMKKKEKKEREGKLPKTPKGKSKFSSKYSERIASIREADEKARIKSKKEQAKKTKRVQKKQTTTSMKTQKEVTQKPKSSRGMKKNTERDK